MQPDRLAPPPSPQPPDRAGAARVIAALTALHSGQSAAAPAADAFLRRHVQPSAAAAAAALPVAAALLDVADPAIAHLATSQAPPALRPAVLHFAAAIIDQHAALAPAAVADLARATLASVPRLPPPTAAALSSAAALPAASAAAAADAPAFRAHMADLRRACAASASLRCVAEEAVAARVARLLHAAPPVDHADGPARAAAVADRTRATCATEAAAVLQNATSVVLAADSSTRARVDAVACFRAWLPFVADVPVLVLDPMVAALRAPYPDVASDVGMSIGDAVDALAAKTVPPLATSTVHRLCAAMRATYEQSASERRVRHAIAEVCVSVADATADYLLGAAPSCREAQAAIAEVVALMSLCVQSPVHDTFEAALMAWDVWIAAASVADPATAAAVAHALPSVVRAILVHLRTLRHCRGRRRRRADDRAWNGHGNGKGDGAAAVGPAKTGAISVDTGDSADADAHRPSSDADDGVADDDGDDSGELVIVRLHNVALDTLHQAAQLMSVADYVQVLAGSLHDESTLFALAAAGDVACGERDVQAVASFVPRVVSMTLSNGTCHPLSVRQSATRALTAFAHVLVSSSVDDEWLSAALTSACSSLADVGHEAALLLREVAEAQASRLIPFLHVLVEAAQSAVGPPVQQTHQRRRAHARDAQPQPPPPSASTAETVVHALALVASELPERRMREDALRRTIGRPVERLRAMAATDSGSCSGAAGIASDIRLVAVAVRHVNDSVVAAALLESLSTPLSSFAERYAWHMGVAPGICQLLEVCARPTLRDPGDAARGLGDAAAAARHYCLVASCIGLASESFVRSGPRGEACWVMTTAELGLQVLSAPQHVSEPCLVAAVQRGLHGLGQFAWSQESGGLKARPDLVAAFLRLVLVLLDDDGTGDANGVPRAGVVAVRKSAEGVAEVAYLSLLSVDDAAVLQPALSWWNRVLSAPDARDVAVRALSHVGGAQALCDAVLLTVGRPRGSRRCAYLAADAMLALRSYCAVGQSLSLTPGSVMAAGTPAAETEASRSLLNACLLSGHARQFRGAVARLRLAATAQGL